MDIRARLLLAFTPLLVLLIVVAVALPLFNARINALLDERIELTEDLLRSQDLVSYIVLEHVAVSRLADGEAGALDDYLRHNETVAALIAAESDREDANQEVEQRIASLYGGLAPLHREVVARFEARDLPGAAAAFGQTRIAQLIEAILRLGAEARAASTAAIQQRDATLQSFQRDMIWAFLGAVAAGMALALGLAWLLIRQIAAPLDRLAADAEQFAGGHLSGELSPAGDIPQVRRLRDSFQQLIDANRQRQLRIQSTLDELQQRVSREEHLRETVAALSVPVVPLAQDTLLLPLVGYLDERRAGELTRSLLQAVQERRARSVVIDITGLAELDHATAERLRQTAQAARLLGCDVTLVGVRAEQALTLSELDLSTSGIQIARDIPAVLRKSNAK